MTIRAIELIANGAPWCITDEMMDTIVAVAERATSPEAVAAQLGRPLDNTRNVTERDGVAIIPVSGPIFPKANLFTEVSGATSIETLALDFNRALANPAINAIVLDMDSPGGNVVGINEFAGMVSAAEKPVTAYVGGMAASAAYWIASAADQVVIDATALVGNIGVVTEAYIGGSKNRLELVSSRAQDKRPNLSTEQGRSVVQAQLDALEDVFLTTVATNREQAVDDIAAHRGRILIGSHAVTAGFADSLGSLESVIAGLSGQTTRGTPMGTNNADNAPEITQSFVAKNHPTIADAFRQEGQASAASAIESQLAAARTEGATAENARVQAVQEQLIPGHEALIQTLMFDGSTSGPEAAVQIVNAEKSARQSTLASIQADAPAPVAQPANDPVAAPAPPNAAPLEERAQAEWDASGELRAEFGSQFGAYLAFKKAEEAGQVKVLGG